MKYHTPVYKFKAKWAADRSPCTHFYVRYGTVHWVSCVKRGFVVEQFYAGNASNDLCGVCALSFGSWR